ncbi:hypothetical protein [Tersicoccus sp. Bi-70]|uniref:hypothetical protein n=1 Tax=Tersicoccus sp. Bi-70 TaxID=1897634 RepID=UPI000976E892|nr:hypothetical protein [Tersicoccus sp. Bi-70]OMH35062.1 hypothetical protein BGP79_01635 [Tersicoccus sp. Bi-70]
MTDETTGPVRRAGDPAQEASMREEAAIAAVTARRATMLTRARRHLGWFSTVLALLIGAAHTVPVVFPPQASLPAFLVAMGLWVVAVLLLTYAYLRTRSATPRGGGRRYTVGLLVTMALYLAGLALTPWETWPVAILIGLLIAAPLTIAGWWRRT